MTLTVRLANARIGILVRKAASIAVVATKVEVGTVFKAVAKKGTVEIIKAAVAYRIGMGVQKPSEVATKETCKIFKKNYQSIAESSFR